MGGGAHVVYSRHYPGLSVECLREATKDLLAIFELTFKRVPPEYESGLRNVV